MNYADENLPGHRGIRWQPKTDQAHETAVSRAGVHRVQVPGSS